MIEGWSEKDGFLTREIEGEYKKLVLLLNSIAYLADKHFHHPDIFLNFKKLEIKLKTHEENKITEKDYKLAKAINSLIDA